MEHAISYVSDTAVPERHIQIARGCREALGSFLWLEEAPRGFVEAWRNIMRVWRAIWKGLTSKSVWQDRRDGPRGWGDCGGGRFPPTIMIHMVLAVLAVRFTWYLYLDKNVAPGSLQ